MANDKFYGLKAKSGNTTEAVAQLDRLNPYEFRKGMDYELTQLGCLRLQESTPEEREKATEKVLKNLQEHGGYYSALIQFEGGMNHGNQITETSFKKYLETYSPGAAGTGMEEVNKELKTDKMDEPKYNKEDYTVALKEAIKNEINNLLKEDEEPTKGQVKKAGMSLSKTKDKLLKLKDKKESLMDKRKKMFGDYKD